MNPSGIVHPYLPGEFAPFFTESVTVQRATENEGDYGAGSCPMGDLPAAPHPRERRARLRAVGVRGTRGRSSSACTRSPCSATTRDPADRIDWIWVDVVLDITAAVRSPFGSGTLLTAREVR